MQITHQRPYFSNLDGLRFFAFLLVFISHAILFIWDGKLFLAQGDLGVSFFFVLSGFLITYLLYFEKESSRGYVKMIYFYARRILRIWPVYFLAIIASFLLMKLQLAHLPFQIIIHSDSLPWYLGFIANFYIISHSETSVVVSVLWSISTEEQFYFIWPLIVSYIKKKHIPLILCLIIISATLFRFLNADSYKVVSYSTFSVMSDLAMGALFGFFAFHDLSFSQRISAFFTKGKVIALYLILAISLYIKMLGPSLIPSSFYRLYIAILPVIFSILFILIIIEQNYSSASLFKVGKSKVLTYLGKISYGLYAYHAIAIAIVFSCLVTWGITSKVIITLASFAFAILIAHLSYKYIELKVLRFKKRVQ